MSVRLSLQRVQALLGSAHRRRILVVGDVMLDEFLFGKVARISPEAPVPVVNVLRQTYHLGGAGNVAANVRALGCEAVLLGVASDDEGGQRIREALTETGVRSSLLPAEDGRPTTVKTRIVAHQQQIVRADREWTTPLPPAVLSRLLALARRELPACDAVVVSDYRKGVVTQRLVRALATSARRRGVPVLVDPKARDLTLYRGADLVTPNLSETEQATGVTIGCEESLAEAGRRLLSRGGFPAALVTRGEHGMTLFERGRPGVSIRSVAREVFDVTGAGDTVIAALAVALSGGARLREAAVLANAAAGVVVGKLGTAQASAAEIRQALDSAP